MTGILAIREGEREGGRPGFSKRKPRKITVDSF